MVLAGQHDFGPMRPHRVGHFGAVGGNDAAIGDGHRGDALPDANDERKAGEKSKRLSGEARGAQSGWDDGERPHTWRSRAPAAARVTAAI
jgi:hypothetical protein